MKRKKYSLREKKHAKTKIALANAFIDRLKTTRFCDISIKEVCQDVEVSEGTFFNYFPQKLDVISFYHQLHFLKVEWEISQKENKYEPLKLLECAFDMFAETIKKPYLFYEIVSVFTAEHVKPKEEDLTPAEKFFAYPDCEGIEHTKVESLDKFFLKYVKQAKKRGQIGKNISTTDAVTALKAVLVGVPLAIETEEFDKIPKIFKKQLGMLKNAFSSEGQR